MTEKAAEQMVVVAFVALVRPSKPARKQDNVVPRTAMERCVDWMAAEGVVAFVPVQTVAKTGNVLAPVEMGTVR